LEAIPLIRKRIPRQDDKTIKELVATLLLPYARKNQPNLRMGMAEIRDRLRHCKTSVIVSGGRKPSGFISLRPVKDTMYIDMLAVDAKVQGKGFGTRLIEHAEREAVLGGYSELFLWVDEANYKAQWFYSVKRYEPILYEKTIRCYLLKKQIMYPLRQNIAF
jgi:ribosomal protein S18 acetylase RimI-like enzyme